ncbi:MAG: helix-turn-helix domain-containing protein [Gallionella sp.]|nr:helix-turn-helix domain-containing protein [Gallionella sp.]
MSIKLMTMVFDGYPTGGGEMLLALSLADFADDDGRRIFPSVDTLGRKTRQSRRSVQTLLRRMEIIGFISPVGKTAKGTTEYRINLDFFDGAQNLRPLPKGRNSQPKGAQKTTKGGANSAPNPPEPSLIQPPHDCGGCTQLIYPHISQAERDAVAQLLDSCPAEFRQPVLDEMAGAIRHQKIRNGVVPYARALARAAAEGRFSPSRLGVVVMAARQAVATVTAAHAVPFVADPAAQETGARILACVRATREKNKTSLGDGWADAQAI